MLSTCKCFSKDGNLSVYNIWDKGNGSQSQGYTSGMLIAEQNDGILIYKCNDYGFETDFTRENEILKKLVGILVALVIVLGGY